MTDAVVLKVESILKKLTDQSGKTSQHYVMVRDQIELLVRAASFLPGSGNPLATDNPEETISLLVDFGAISSIDELVSASDAVTEAFTSYFNDALSSFGERVGADSISTKNPIKTFETRRAEEVAQQNEWQGEALKFQTQLTEAAEVLGVALTIPTTTVTAQPKLGLFTKVFTAAPEEKGKKKSTSFDWQTERIFDPNSEDAKRLARIFAQTKKLEKEALIQALATTLGITPESLTPMFNKQYHLTIQQIEASRQTLLYVEKDYKSFQDPMTAGLELQSTLVDLANFFGYSIGKSSSSKSKATR